MFKDPTELSNVVSAVVYCENDATLLLVGENGEYWIPTVKTVTGFSWEKTIAREMLEIFGTDTINKLLKMTKIWVPRQLNSFVFNIIYKAVVDIPTKNRSKYTMAKYRGKLRWVTEADLYKILMNHSLKSCELLELLCLAKNTPLGRERYPDEVIALENFYETTDDILVSGKGNNTNFTLVEMSGIDRSAQEFLVTLFVFVTFPACYMSRKAFGKLVSDLGWKKDDISSLFQAADIKNRAGLSFRELLYFLAAVDPNTTHGGVAAEKRCRYMFKYYDKDRDNMLKANEFINLVGALRKSRKVANDIPSNVKEANDIYKAMGFKEGTSISIEDFLKAVCDLKIRGTSAIFRSPMSLTKYQKAVAESKRKSIDDSCRPLIGRRLSQGRDYDVASHVIRIQRDGTAINIEELRQINEAVSVDTMQTPTNEDVRKMSIDLFNQRSVSNELLKGTRYIFNCNKTKDARAQFTWGVLDPVNHAKNLIEVCRQVKELLKGETRLIEVASPVYIMGDLHGNVSDLFNFEKILWHIGPGLCPCNLLFLGDYVDRGNYSLEVISYLFGYKLQTPKKINLVRGNHEIREVQKMFTFYKECILKLGDKLGNEVWSAVNSVFDYLPIAAVIDGKVFCCHGGVPPPWLCPVISAINDIPVPLDQPDVQSSLAWEIMWNDPVRKHNKGDHDFEKINMELVTNEGFATNVKRGTAHVFNQEALEKFLKTNGLTHLIRAHEMVQYGFEYMLKGKLLSVFSSSKYCGAYNDAACIMADQGKLRVIRFEHD